jgi:hypothetical protein
MKIYLYQILSAIAGALIFGFFGLIKFAGYGANDCDMDGKTCDCFCCHMFGLRGYESCGDFGLLAGFLAGALLGLAVYRLIKIIVKYASK